MAPVRSGHGPALLHDHSPFLPAAREYVHESVRADRIAAPVDPGALGQNPSEQGLPFRALEQPEARGHLCGAGHDPVYAGCVPDRPIEPEGQAPAGFSQLDAGTHSGHRAQPGAVAVLLGRSFPEALVRQLERTGHRSPDRHGDCRYSTDRGGDQEYRGRARRGCPHRRCLPSVHAAQNRSAVAGADGGGRGTGDLCDGRIRRRSGPFDPGVLRIAMGGAARPDRRSRRNQHASGWARPQEGFALPNTGRRTTTRPPPPGASEIQTVPR